MAASCLSRPTLSPPSLPLLLAMRPCPSVLGMAGSFTFRVIPSLPVKTVTAQLLKSISTRRMRRASAVAMLPGSPPAQDAQADCLQDWPVGLGHLYHIGKLLGKGAYGAVNLAVNKKSGQQVAVKTLLKRRGKVNPTRILTKFKSEVELLRRMERCGAVVNLIDAFQDSEHLYLVMELCRGGDLDAMLLESGAFSERQAAAVLFETLQIIAECHDVGIIHGDVKPANFMLRQPLKHARREIESGLEGYWLKAIDFGCSQSILPNTRLSKRTGTPIYMAPEVFKREYDTQCDLWSLGMMFYQLVSARFPYWASLRECQELSMEQVMTCVLLDDIPVNWGPWLRMSRPGLDLFHSLMQRNPRQRITAAEALQHQWFQQQLGVSPTSHRSNIVPIASGRTSKAHAATRAVQYGRQ